MIQNDVSSTKVRFFLRKGLSVRYLLPVGVLEYIEKNGIYVDEGRDAWNGNIITSQSAEWKMRIPVEYTGCMAAYRQLRYAD